MKDAATIAVDMRGKIEQDREQPNEKELEYLGGINDKKDAFFESLSEKLGDSVTKDDLKNALDWKFLTTWGIREAINNA